MTVHMVFFCTDGEWSALKRRERRLSAAFRILAVLTPAVFIILCLLVRTENARTIHAVLLAATAAPGAAAILIRLLLLRPVQREMKHLEMLRNGEKDFLEGLLTVSGESFRIPKSVLIRRVFLKAGEDERPVMLNVDERWADRLPPDGTRVRLAAVNSYIAGLEPAGAERDRPAADRKTSGVRAFLRGVSLAVPPLVLWVFFVLVFGSFIFYRITDTAPDRKITIYMDGVTTGEEKLAAWMEKQMAGQIRMVKIHPFSYAMFGSRELQTADLLIVPDSDAGKYGSLFAEGEGWLLYNPEDGTAVAGDTFAYTAEGKDEPYRLYIGAESAHLEDGLARQAAELLISLGPEEEEEET